MVYRLPPSLRRETHATSTLVEQQSLPRVDRQYISPVNIDITVLSILTLLAPLFRTRLLNPSHLSFSFYRRVSHSSVLSYRTLYDDRDKRMKIAGKKKRPSIAAIKANISINLNRDGVSPESPSCRNHDSQENPPTVGINVIMLQRSTRTVSIRENILTFLFQTYVYRV